MSACSYERGAQVKTSEWQGNDTDERLIKDSLRHEFSLKFKGKCVKQTMKWRKLVQSMIEMFETMKSNGEDAEMNDSLMTLDMKHTKIEQPNVWQISMQR